MSSANKIDYHNEQLYALANIFAHHLHLECRVLFPYSPLHRSVRFCCKRNYNIRQSREREREKNKILIKYMIYRSSIKFCPNSSRPERPVQFVWRMFQHVCICLWGILTGQFVRAVGLMSDLLRITGCIKKIGRVTTTYAQENGNRKLCHGIQYKCKRKNKDKKYTW